MPELHRRGRFPPKQQQQLIRLPCPELLELPTEEEEEEELPTTTANSSAAAARNKGSLPPGKGAGHWR